MFVGITVGARGVKVEVGVAVGGTPPPLQSLPFSEKLMGRGLVPLNVPWKPKLTEPPFALIILL